MKNLIKHGSYEGWVYVIKAQPIDRRNKFSTIGLHAYIRKEWRFFFKYDFPIMDNLDGNGIKALAKIKDTIDSLNSQKNLLKLKKEEMSLDLETAKRMMDTLKSVEAGNQDGVNEKITWRPTTAHIRL